MRALLMCLVLVGGCVTSGADTWTHATKSALDLARDKYDCDQAAARTFPPTYVTETRRTPIFDEPETKTCSTQPNGDVVCETKPAYLAVETTTVDASKADRERSAEDCIRARGYRKERVE